MAGYVLVLAILILGGILATLGDRIGTKVGKSRLSIFNLRPKNTATLITIATGGLISASTLGVLLATSSQLQDGLFRLDSIRADLKSAQTEKEKITTELTTTKRQRDQEKRNLDQINNSLAAALFRQSRTQAQLQSAQKKFQSASQELNKVQAQEQELISKIKDLGDRQKNLMADSKKLIDERNQLNIDLEKIIGERQELRNRVDESQTRLTDLEKQRTALNSELKTLETNREQLVASIQALRRGNVAIQSEQVLTAAVVNGGLSPQDLRLAVFQVLQQADQNARVLLDFPAESRPVIQVSETQIDNLLQKLGNGQSYILRILSAGNYLRKENNVAILADITPNKEVFKPDELIASLQFKPNMSDAEIESQLDKLFLLVSFRARQQGVLPNPFTGKVGNFPQSALFDLTREFKQYKGAIEIQAIAKETIFTGSPLTLILVVLENGVEIRRFG
jgi:uncharacterized protein (DUF3084 family)